MARVLWANGNLEETEGKALASRTGSETDDAQADESGVGAGKRADGHRSRSRQGYETELEAAVKACQ